MPLFAPLAGRPNEEMAADCQYLNERWMDMRKLHPEMEEQELWEAFLKKYKYGVISDEIGLRRRRGSHKEQVEAPAAAASHLPGATAVGEGATRRIQWLYVRNCKTGVFAHVPVDFLRAGGATGGTAHLSSCKALSQKERKVAYELQGHVQGKITAVFAQVFAKAFDGEQ